MVFNYSALLLSGHLKNGSTLLIYELWNFLHFSFKVEASRSFTKHRKIASSFRDMQLFDIFQLGINLLKKAHEMIDTIDFGDPDQVSFDLYCGLIFHDTEIGFSGRKLFSLKSRCLLVLQKFKREAGFQMRLCQDKNKRYIEVEEEMPRVISFVAVVQHSMTENSMILLYCVCVFTAWITKS